MSEMIKVKVKEGNKVIGGTKDAPVIARGGQEIEVPVEHVLKSRHAFDLTDAEFKSLEKKKEKTVKPPEKK